MTKLIVCPNDVKIKILEDNSKNNELVNIKFMTKKEFIDNYYFSYDDKTLYYLMDKYHFNLGNHKIVQIWEQKYKEKGPEVFNIENRGRKRKIIKARINAKIK